jgi:ribonuclease Z
MRVLMLGTAAAVPDPDRNHSSILVTVRGRHYLFDCGQGATHQMIRSHINPATVDIVFLSHLHFDHIADFPFFVLSSWIADRKNAPIVIGPRGVKNFVDHLFEGGAFQTDIDVRAKYPNRASNIHVLKPDVRECEPGLVFEDDLVKVTTCYVEHIPTEQSPCFGMRLDTIDGKSMVFSGDTAPCDRLIELAQDTDLLIHECTFPEKALEFRKSAGVGLWAHTSPGELGKIATKSGAKSVVATHFASFDTTNPVVMDMLAIHMPRDLIGPDLMEDVVTDIRKNYAGELRLAHDGMRIDI